jgi:hypothetical protein
MLLPPPSDRVAWTDRRLLPLWLVLGAAFIVAMVFLPRTLINGDEVYYAGEARTLLRGRLVPIDGDPLPYFPELPSAAVRYPLAWPTMLAAGAALAFRGMFVVPVIIHLLGAAAVGRMFVRRGAPAWLAVAYVFHPAIWLYARTLMSDVPTVALLMIALDAWEQGALAIGASAFASTLLVRLASAMLMAGFGLAVLVELRRRRRDALVLVCGCAATALALLVLNTLTYGHPFRYTYTEAAAGSLNGASIPQNLLLYVGGLLVIPPFPLAWLIARPRLCDRWVLAAVPLLGFFALYSYHDTAPSLLQTIIGGQRLVLSAHALLIVATVRAWSRIPLLRFRELVIAAGIVAGIAECRLTRRLYARYEPAVDALVAKHPSRVGYNDSAARVAFSVPANAYYRVEDREIPSDAEAAVIALRQTTNRPGDYPISYRLPASLRDRLADCRVIGDFLVFDLTAHPTSPGSPCVVPAAESSGPEHGQDPSLSPP